METGCGSFAFPLPILDFRYFSGLDQFGWTCKVQTFFGPSTQEVRFCLFSAELETESEHTIFGAPQMWAKACLKKLYERIAVKSPVFVAAFSFPREFNDLSVNSSNAKRKPAPISKDIALRI